LQVLGGISDRLIGLLGDKDDPAVESDFDASDSTNALSRTQGTGEFAFAEPILTTGGGLFDHCDPSTGP
jgi:hypothetical protein